MEEARKELTPKPKLPYCYAVCNGDDDGTGIFIPCEERDKTEWKSTCSDDACEHVKCQPVRYTYRTASSLKIDGYIFTGQVYMLVLDKSPALVHDQKTFTHRMCPKKEHGQERVEIDEHEQHVRYVIILLLNEKFEMMHKIPLKMKLSGNFLFSFNQAYDLVLGEIVNKTKEEGMLVPVSEAEMEGLAPPVPVRVPVEFDHKNSENLMVRLISSTFVFAPVLRPVKVGVKKTSMACKVTATKFDASKWQDYVIFTRLGESFVANYIDKYYWKKYITMKTSDVAAATPEPTMNCFDDIDIE